MAIRGKIPLINSQNPDAWGRCDRTGLPTMYSDLVPQYEYVGDKLQWTGLMVNRKDMDMPNPQLVTPRLKPDPVPVNNPRYFPLPQQPFVPWGVKAQLGSDLFTTISWLPGPMPVFYPGQPNRPWDRSAVDLVQPGNPVTGEYYRIKVLYSAGYKESQVYFTTTPDDPNNVDNWISDLSFRLPLELGKYKIAVYSVNNVGYQKLSHGNVDKELNYNSSGLSDFIFYEVKEEKISRDLIPFPMFYPDPITVLPGVTDNVLPLNEDHTTIFPYQTPVINFEFNNPLNNIDLTYVTSANPDGNTVRIGNGGESSPYYLPFCDGIYSITSRVPLVRFPIFTPDEISVSTFETQNLSLSVYSIVFPHQMPVINFIFDSQYDYIEITYVTSANPDGTTVTVGNGGKSSPLSLPYCDRIYSITSGKQVASYPMFTSDTINVNPGYTIDLPLSNYAANFSEQQPMLNVKINRINDYATISYEVTLSTGESFSNEVDVSFRNPFPGLPENCISISSIICKADSQNQTSVDISGVINNKEKDVRIYGTVQNYYGLAIYPVFDPSPAIVLPGVTDSVLPLNATYTDIFYEQVPVLTVNFVNQSSSIKVGYNTSAGNGSPTLTGANGLSQQILLPLCTSIISIQATTQPDIDYSMFIDVPVTVFPGVTALGLSLTDYTYSFPSQHPVITVNFAIGDIYSYITFVYNTSAGTSQPVIVSAIDGLSQTKNLPLCTSIYSIKATTPLVVDYPMFSPRNQTVNPGVIVLQELLLDTAYTDSFPSQQPAITVNFANSGSAILFLSDTSSEPGGDKVIVSAINGLSQQVSLSPCTSITDIAVLTPLKTNNPIFLSNTVTMPRGKSGSPFLGAFTNDFPSQEPVINVTFEFSTDSFVLTYETSAGTSQPITVSAINGPSQQVSLPLCTSITSIGYTTPSSNALVVTMSGTFSYPNQEDVAVSGTIKNTQGNVTVYGIINSGQEDVTISGTIYDNSKYVTISGTVSNYKDIIIE